MGSWRMQGRERVVVPAMAFVVAFAVAGAWRLGVLDSGDAGAGTGPSDRPGTSEGDADDARPMLAAASYLPGDCVAWDLDGGIEADTDVVPCDEQHRIQITEEVPIGRSGIDYPSSDDWGLLLEARCKPAAERFLGVPLDPYGRFYADAIFPSEEGWAHGDDTMYCGISRVGSRDGRDDVLFAEDVRGADQAHHYSVGSCVALPADAWPLLVPCAEGHHMEIVGELDLSGRQEIPTGAQERGLFDDCFAQARTYLGVDPVAPWQAGKETMAEESWAAGTRTVHCFLGQWDAAGELVEVTGSAKG